MTHVGLHDLRSLQTAGRRHDAEVLRLVRALPGVDLSGVHSESASSGGCDVVRGCVACT